MSQHDGRLEKTLLSTKLPLLILNVFYQQRSSRSLLQQRASCSPTLIMEVVEAEKEAEEGEEKERTANMTAVPSLRRGKVIRKKETTSSVEMDSVLNCLSFMLPGKRQKKKKKVPEVTVVLVDANDTEKSANPGGWRTKMDTMTKPPRIRSRCSYFPVCKTFLEHFSHTTTEGQEKDLRSYRCTLWRLGSRGR